jgi:hypothetical protein
MIHSGASQARQASSQGFGAMVSSLTQWGFYIDFKSLTEAGSRIFIGIPSGLFGAGFQNERVE